MTYKEKQIIDKYIQENSTSSSVRKEFNIEASFLYKILKKYNIKPKLIKTTPDKEKKIVELYTNKKLNTTQISIILNISKSTAISILKKHNIQMLGQKKSKEIEKQVIELYKIETLTSVAATMAITREAVARILKRNNIEIRPKRTSNYIENDIIKYYKNNIVSLEEISKIYNLSRQTILNILKRNNIKTRNNSQIRLRLSDEEYEKYLNILPDIEKYRKKVISLTNKQPLHILRDYDKRGNAGVCGAYQIDHKYSVLEGFKNNIAVEIISNIANLEMIKWEDNLKKRTQCSITLEELTSKINLNIVL